MAFDFVLRFDAGVGERCALAQRVLQIDGNAVLLEHIGECFVRQFLNGRHPVAAELLQLVESIVVKGDQFAHLPACFCLAADLD